MLILKHKWHLEHRKYLFSKENDIRNIENVIRISTPFPYRAELNQVHGGFCGVFGIMTRPSNV